jgi:Anion-transporting ATPase
MRLPSLIFVTGKGGTGKSSVAAALALASSHRGKTVLTEIDRPRSGVGRRTNGPRIARLLHDQKSSGSSAAPENGAEVRSLSSRSELEAFIQRIVPLKAISRRMLRSHTFAYVTAALPGLEAFLVLERLRLLAESARQERGLVIVDGPASGGAMEMLGVTKGVRHLAQVGTLNRLAAGLDAFLANPEYFGVLVTVLPEQFAIREALETAAYLRDDLRIRCVAIVVNRVPEPLFSAAECAKLPRHHRSFALQRRAATNLAAEAHRQFEGAGLEVVELPMLYSSGFGRPEVETLASTIDRSLER